MKKFNLLLVSSAMILTVLTQCKKDETKPEDTPVTPTTMFTVKVDGTLYTADSAEYNVYNNRINIFAKTAGATKLEINLPGKDIKTYTLGSMDSSATYINGSTFYTSATGTVVITKYDTAAKKLSGTFSFTGVNGSNPNDTKILTEGKFTDIPVQ